MGRQVIIALLLTAQMVWAQAGRIYTAPEGNGKIIGTLPVGEITHALAVDSQRLKVFRGTTNGGQFRFEHLPVGKFDLVLVTKERGVYEGLRLGNDQAVLPTELRENLEKRVAVADAFFNRSKLHRFGIDGGKALVFVERVRDKGDILKQSGEVLGENLRRLEVIELEQATDDWQMIQSRHLYREGEPIQKGSPFLKHVFVAGLGNIRVVDSIKDLGTLSVPKD